MSVELIPLEGLPEVEPGDDLAALLEPSLTAKEASEGDVVAITQKVVSKAEGRLVPADDRARWIERESVEVVARRGELLITRTRHGFVCANAGVDASNVRAGFLTLLPAEPDASAERLQKELSSRLALSRLGVVITDTFGRPWREGVVDVAIGCAGLPALVDLRGHADDHGRELETTVVALADAVAAASGLVMTKTARVPAALVRGLDATFRDAPPGPASALIRTAEGDLFRTSPLLAVERARPSSTLGAGEAAASAVEEAVRVASTRHEGVAFVVLTSPAARRRVVASAPGLARDPFRSASTLILPCLEHDPTGDDDASLAAGGALTALEIALHGLGLAFDRASIPRSDRGAVRAALGLGSDGVPLSLLAVGPMTEGGTPTAPPFVEIP